MMDDQSAPSASAAEKTEAGAVTGPLAGVRVLDLTSVIMGPYASQILGDFGADVICVEAAGGDAIRVTGAGPHPELSGNALNFLRNKRNIALDLRNPYGHLAFMRLAASCDIFLTNLRPGPRARLGISYEDVRAVRPDIIYCHAQGWSLASGRADDPAYDDVIQTAGGMADLFLRQNGIPTIAPTAIADKLSGITMVYGVLAALYHRQKTGKGQCVEVPMKDAMVAFVMAEHGHDAIPQPTFGPPGYQRIISAQRAPLPTKDGYLQIVLYSKSQWADMLAEGGDSGAYDDPRLQTPATRNQHFVALYQRMGEVLKIRTSAEWIAWCRPRGIACAEVASLEDLIADFPVAEHHLAGHYKQIPSPVRFSATPASVHRHAPLIGEHNVEILAEIGYATAEIAALEAAGGLFSVHQVVS